METKINPLRTSIEYALTNHIPESMTSGEYIDFVDDVEFELKEYILAEIKKAKVEAWENGFYSGFNTHKNYAMNVVLPEPPTTNSEDK